MELFETSQDRWCFCFPRLGEFSIWQWTEPWGRGQGQHHYASWLIQTTVLRIFPCDGWSDNWMRNLFSNETSDMPDNVTVGEQESLIEVSFETLKSAFKKHSLLDFWIQQQGKYPALSDKAMRFLLAQQQLTVVNKKLIIETNGINRLCVSCLQLNRVVGYPTVILTLVIMVVLGEPDFFWGLTWF